MGIPIQSYRMINATDADGVVEALQAKIQEVGGVTQLARDWGIDLATLANIANKTRPPSPRVAAALGFRKVVLYVKGPPVPRNALKYVPSVATPWTREKEEA